MRSQAATHLNTREPERWPSSVDASTLLLSLEALARWREHLVLSQEDEAFEAAPLAAVAELADGSGMRHWRR